MEQSTEMTRQQASAEQQQRESLLEGERSPVLQQLYTSNEEGAQIIHPGGSPGSAVGTDHDSQSSVIEISAGTFAQARGKRNSGPGKAEDIAHSASPSPDGFTTPLTTPLPGTASSMEVSVMQCALQSRGSVSPGSLGSVEQEDWGDETSPDLAAVLGTVTVRDIQDGRLAKSMHALMLKGSAELYIANASAEDMRIANLLLHQLSEEVTVECLHTEGDTHTVFVGPPAVTLQFRESKLHPLLGQILEPDVAVQLVTNALDRVWGRIEGTTDRTRTVLITPRVEDFSTHHGDPDMARALVKLVVCSRNLELAPSLRDLLQNALFTAIHDYAVELLDLALKFGVDTALTRLQEDALHDRSMPINAGNPTEQGAVAQEAEEAPTGTIMRYAAWGAMSEGERQTVARRAEGLLHEHEDEGLQPVITFVSQKTNCVLKLVRVGADGTCMAQAVAWALAGYPEFATTLLQACGDYLAKHPEVVEMREGDLRAEELRSKLLSGQEWGSGVELAVMAQLFAVDINILAVKKEKNAFETEFITINWGGYDDSEAVNILLYAHHYYAVVPVSELCGMASGVGKNLADSVPPLLTAELSGLPQRFRVMASPQRTVAPTAMARLKAWEQQVSARYQQPPPRGQDIEYDESKAAIYEAAYALFEPVAPAVQRTEVDLTAMLPGAGAKPVSAGSAESSPATVITVSSDESGRFTIAQRQPAQGQRGAKVTPGSVASQTSSMQVAPGTNKKTASAAAADGHLDGRCDVPLDTMRKRSRAKQVCNYKTLYAINCLSQHEEWHKDEFFLKAVRHVSANGTPLTYRLTVIGNPYVLHAAFALLDCHFELYILAPYKRQQMYFDHRHTYLVSQRVSTEKETNDMLREKRKLLKEKDVLLKMADLRHEAQLGTPSPAASARGSTDGDHTDEDTPISDNERITPAAVHSGRKVSFATAVSPERRSPTNSPTRGAPTVKEAHAHAGQHAMVGMRAVGLMATTAALQGAPRRAHGPL